MSVMKKILCIVLFVLLMPGAFSQSQGNVDVNIRSENKKEKGYFNIMQISMLMGNRQITETIPNFYYPGSYPYLSSSVYIPSAYFITRTKLQVSPSVSITNGYRFNEHWAAGIGVGYEIFKHNLCPVFADVRYSVWNNKISPVFAFKTGYAIGNLKKQHYDELDLDYQPYSINNADFRNYGGLMVQPEMGVKVILNENADLLITVAYRYQKIRTITSQSFEYNYYDEWEHKESLNRLMFGVAIMFR